MNPRISGAKSRKEVAREYGISARTLYRWIKKANLHIPPGLIDPLPFADHLRDILGSKRQ